LHITLPSGLKIADMIAQQDVISNRQPPPKEKGLLFPYYNVMNPK